MKKSWQPSKILYYFQLLCYTLYSVMPPSKGQLWKFFYRGEKQNTSQFKAYCIGCIQHYCVMPPNVPIDVDQPDLDIEVDFTEGWFKAGYTL